MPEPRILLRERRIGELMDLALLLVRRHSIPLVLAGLPGVLLLWVITTVVVWRHDNEGIALAVMVLLVAPFVVLPIVNALLVALLGQLLTAERVRWRAAMARVWAIRGQLFNLAVLRCWPLLAIIALPFGWALFAYVVWLAVVFIDLLRYPWLVEIMVLEGQLWSASRRRARAFAQRPDCTAGQAEMVNWLLMILFAVVASMAGSEFYQLLETGRLWGDHGAEAYNPLGHWLPWLGIGPALIFAGVVRYLSYLNGRTLAEGWELDTRLRLAGQSLAGGR